MRNKKGFTLTELLVTLCIIAIIAAIIIPTIITFSNKTKKELYDSKVTLVLEAAKEWGEVHLNDLKPTECTNVKVKTLIKEGYLTGEKSNKSVMVNPITNESMNEMNVCVTFERDTVYFVSTKLQDDVPKLVIKPQIITKSYTTQATDLLSGTRGYNSEGSLSVTIKEGETTLEQNTVLEIGTHTITYETTDGVFKTTGKRTYVINPPDITLTINPSTKTYVYGETYNLLEGVSAVSYYGNDLQITSIKEGDTVLTATTEFEVGKHTVTYTTEPDQNGKVGIGTRVYTIVGNTTEFAYSESDQTYRVTVGGRYEVEAYGAQGGGTGGKGGYLKATVLLSAGDIITVNTGGSNKYNGGAASAGTNSYNGGGATTIRQNGTYIMAAAGGGGTGNNGTAGTAGGENSGTGGAAAASGGTTGQNGTAYIGTTISGGGSSSLDKTVVTSIYLGDTCTRSCSSYKESCICTSYFPDNTCPAAFRSCTRSCSSYTTTCTPNYSSSSATYKGLPGNGGTTVVSDEVTIETNTPGQREGNGYAKIKYVSAN